MFGRPTEVREAPEKKELTDFVSEGNVKERSTMFGRPTEVREDAPEKELTGFASEGNVKERSTMFGQKPLDAISDDEEEKQDVDEEELAAEQARVSQLSRDELKVYSYEELTVGVNGVGDG